jgi:8-oxo-dGTP pyrophosphatase MutT (NUDIX family)
MAELHEWILQQAEEGSPLIPAATVVVLRDHDGALETLMLRRSSALSFAEGMWVFPGGKIDAADHRHGPDLTGLEAEAQAARVAAVREAAEEAALTIELAGLVHYSHWIPPREAPKRFSTWFFLAPAPAGGEVAVDDGEIVHAEWARPGDVLERQRAGRAEMLPPTWMTLHDLAGYTTVEAAIAAAAARGPQRFCTRIVATPHGAAAAWEGDAAYDPRLPPHARHRLVMSDHGWTLERT